MVRWQPAELFYLGSIPGITLMNEYRSVAQLVECAPDKREVVGSSPIGPISCFSGVMVAYDPSKVRIRVRLPTLAFCMGSYKGKCLIYKRGFLSNPCPYI